MLKSVPLRLFFTLERGSLHPPLVSWGITDNFRLLPQWRCGFYAAVFIASHLVEFLHQHSEPWTPCKEQRVSQGLEETYVGYCWMIPGLQCRDGGNDP